MGTHEKSLIGLPTGQLRYTSCWQVAQQTWNVRLLKRKKTKKTKNRDFEIWKECFSLHSWTDYLKVTNENNKNFGVYCGQWTEKVILVTGDLVLMIFHSNVFYNHYEEKGFLISFTAIPPGKCLENTGYYAVRALSCVTKKDVSIVWIFRIDGIERGVIRGVMAMYFIDLKWFFN